MNYLEKNKAVKDVLYYKGKLLVDHKLLPLIQILIKEHHSTPLGGHVGVRATVKKLRQVFYWKKMKLHVEQYVKACEECQRNKHENVLYPVLLQPPPIPERVWTDLSMDFITCLPKSQKFTVIYVVVDRLSKYAHFFPLSHPYTAKDVAIIFFQGVFKLHGLPKTIVSDRDSIFLSKFWQELFKLQGSTLKFSTAYHP